MIKTESKLEQYTKKIDINDHKKIIYEVLCILQRNLSKDNKKDEIFLSEADFQFSFAQELDKILKDKQKESPKIILEYPHFFTETSKQGRSFIDLYFKYNSINYFVEFKYKLTSIEDSVKRHNNSFCIKPQGASNNGRYLIYQDIERMEKIKSEHGTVNNECCKSYVILITNDSQYWRINQKDGCKCFNYPLADLTKTEDWCKKRETTKCNKEFEDCSYPPLNIEKNYQINWQDFLDLKCTKNGNFRVLIIDCNEIADC